MKCEYIIGRALELCIRRKMKGRGSKTSVHKQNYLAIMLVKETVKYLMYVV